MSNLQNSERISELAIKYQLGTITPEERAEFDRWYDENAPPEAGSQDAGSPENSPQDARSLEDSPQDAGPPTARSPENGPQDAGSPMAGSPENSPQDARAQDAGNDDAVRRRIFRAIAESLGLANTPVPPPAEEQERQKNIRRFTRILSAAAAAAVAAVSISSAWLYFAHRQQPSAAFAGSRPRQNRLQPGGNKATLILSDGTTVTLQPASRRDISDKGGASIRQQDSELVYHAATPAGGKEGPMSYNTITVPRGGQYHLVLADGTAVWLNSASSLRYPTVFRGPTRLVTLTGEGYFEVAKDKDHPFRVEADGEVIDVLGTRFNVNCYTDESDIRTTLLQGSVRVSLPTRYDSLVIRPGQQAVAGNKGRLYVVDHADIEQAVAWKNGYFELRDADIRTIMRQAARWYDVEIEYQGPPPVQQLSGKMRRSADVAQFLDMLAYFNIHFQIRGRKITVMAGGGAATIHS